MKVFVTGASGWIGSATVDELLRSGHEVLAFARSDRSAASLTAKGVVVRRGDLDDRDSIRAGAAEADAVVHLANKHDWAHPEVSNAAERGAVEVIGDELRGSGRAFVLASGMAGAPGKVQTEEDASPHHGPGSMRGGSENLALEYVDRGVRALPVRFAPTVHGAGDRHGFVATIAKTAREKGVSAYVGDGSNRWPAVHVTDAARVVVQGLEQAPAGTILNAAGEGGVATRDIAEAIGDALAIPVTSIDAAQAQEHFGFLGMFFSMDIAASSARTQELLGWSPSGPTLLDDIRAGHYPG